MSTMHNVCFCGKIRKIFFRYLFLSASMFQSEEYHEHDQFHRQIPVVYRLFVCAEVLWPSQPIGVMLSTVNLPNHTFSGQAQTSKLFTSIASAQKLTTALLESADHKKYFIINFHKNVADPAGVKSATF